MKAGVYTRVSTDMQVQRGESLDEQFDEARLYCKYKGVPIVDIYREEGKSAKNTDRPELQRLLRDCKKGKIDIVIVKKLDRLSRSILDFEKMLRFFEDHHIALISLKESFDTSSPMSMAAVRIILVFAQLEREQTSERIRDVMMYRAKQGIWTGGFIPLGYDYIPKKGLVVNEEEKKQVIYIFQKYIELGSYIKVAQHINALGYRTKRLKTKQGKERGGIMHIDSHIARTIQNPVYIGKIPYKSERYSGTHQAIVPEDLFNQAQAMRNENWRRRGNIRKENKHNFLLEGLIRCGECNAQMTPRWAMGKSKRYFYYCCTKVGHQGRGACGIRRISAPVIEQLVLNSIRSLTKDDALFHEVMAGNDEETRQRIAGLRETERKQEAMVSAIDKKVQMLTDAFSETIGQDKGHVTALELDRLDKERKETLQRQAQARIEANDLETKSISKAAARQTLTAFTEVYGTLSPFDKKALMAQLIHSIIFTKEKVTIRYYVLSDMDILINEKAPQPRVPVSQRLLLSGAFKEQNKTIIAVFNIETYKGKDGKVMLRVIRGKSNEKNLPGSEDGRMSVATGRPDRCEAGQSPCEERAV